MRVEQIEGEGILWMLILKNIRASVLFFPSLKIKPCVQNVQWSIEIEQTQRKQKLLICKLSMGKNNFIYLKRKKKNKLPSFTIKVNALGPNVS